MQEFEFTLLPERVDEGVGAGGGRNGEGGGSPATDLSQIPTGPPHNPNDPLLIFRRLTQSIKQRTMNSGKNSFLFRKKGAKDGDDFETQSR